MIELAREVLEDELPSKEPKALSVSEWESGSRFCCRTPVASAWPWDSWLRGCESGSECEAAEAWVWGVEKVSWPEEGGYEVAVSAKAAGAGGDGDDASCEGLAAGAAAVAGSGPL
jgi:hypothetical protein